MIPEDFKRYHSLKGRTVRHKREHWSVTLEGLWQICGPIWSQWQQQGPRSWFVSRQPGETEWRDDTIILETWQEHYEALSKLCGPKKGRPCPDMRDFTEHPVRVEIDGVIYPSLNEASRQTGRAASTINHRCANVRFPNYRRLS